jgi:hypothetical protein
MPKILEEWTVKPHGKLSRVDTNIWTVVGELPMPLGKFPRRMTVVRLDDSRLVIFSAIALDENEMQALESFGKPAFLVVPSGIHRLDAKIWKDRYPDLTVIAPPGARDKVEEVIHVDCTSIDFGDPNVSFMSVPGTDGLEAAITVKTPSGTTLVINDLIWNLKKQHGLSKLLFRAIGFTGARHRPRIPPLVQRKAVKDKPALRSQLEEWAALQGITRIIVSHGDIVTDDARTVLRDLADSLAA